MDDELLDRLTDLHSGELKIVLNRLALSDFVLEKEQDNWPVIEGIRFGKGLVLQLGALVDEFRPEPNMLEYSLEDGESPSVVDELIEGMTDFLVPRLRISSGLEFKHVLKRDLLLFRRRAADGPHTRVGLEFRHRYRLRIGIPQLDRLRAKLSVEQELYEGMHASAIYRAEFDPKDGLSHQVAIGFQVRLSEHVALRVEALRGEKRGAELGVSFEIFELLSGPSAARQAEIDDALRVLKPGEGTPTQRSWDEKLSSLKALNRVRSRVKHQGGAVAEGSRKDG